MPATSRRNAKATSQRAAESINAHDEDPCRKAVRSCLPLNGDFTQPDIETLMRSLPGCTKPNGGRWSDQSVRRILHDFEIEGKIEPLPDEPGQTHSRFRVVREPVVVPVEAVKTVQKSMF